MNIIEATSQTNIQHTSGQTNSIISQKMCSGCQVSQPLYNFYKTNSGSYRSMCIKCWSEAYSKHERALLFRINRLFHNAKARSKRFSLNGRDINFDISQNDLLNLWLNQDGKCALTGLCMRLNGNRYQEDIVSLDRIDSNGGYTKDNIQLVAYRANVLKRDMSIQDFHKYCARDIVKRNIPSHNITYV